MVKTGKVPSRSKEVTERAERTPNNKENKRRELEDHPLSPVSY